MLDPYRASARQPREPAGWPPAPVAAQPSTSPVVTLPGLARALVDGMMTSDYLARHASLVTDLTEASSLTAAETDLHGEAGAALTPEYIARVRELLAGSHSTVALLRALSVVTAEEGDPVGAAMLSDFAHLYTPVEHAGR